MKYALFIIIALVSSVSAGQVVSAHGGEVGEVSKELIKIDPASGENYHIEVKPQTLEGYRIPNMNISATVTSLKTGETSVVQLHGMFGGNYHYGSNIALKEGEYNFAFHLEPPTFMREGARANSWMEPVEADFNFSAVNNLTGETVVGEKVTKDMKIAFGMEVAEPMWEFPEKAAPAPAPVAPAAPSGASSDASSKIFFAALALVVGGGLGFFFGKSKRAVVAQ